jgi:hypothetical protein
MLALLMKTKKKVILGFLGTVLFMLWLNAFTIIGKFLSD